MSEAGRLNTDDPKDQFWSSGRRSSAISSWNGSNTPEKEEVPVHLFLSPTDSGSTPSSSRSNSVKKERRKKNTQETSFILKAAPKERKSGVQLLEKKDVEAVFSSPNQSIDCSSSDSEDLSFNSKKGKKLSSSYKPTPPFRTNKVHGSKVQEESRKIRMIETESETPMKPKQIIKDDRCPSVGDSSADTEVRKSVTSVSEMSYRERIRDRFNTVKEKAVESLSRPQSRSQSKLKLLLMRQGGTRWEELLKQEEDEVSAAIERHERLKLRWRKAYEASLEKEEKNQEEYDYFFMETTDSELQIPTQSEDKPISSSISVSPENRGESKILTSEFLGIKEDWNLVEFAKPQITNLRSKKWEENLFYPSTKPVSIADKLEPGLAPRCIEEEGLYMGTKIKIPKKMKNKMENRILKTPDGRKWFDKEGELITICPLKPLPTRPYFDEEQNENRAQLIFKPATLGNMNHRFMDLSQSLNYVLDIDISSVEFSHHPLFSREHVVAQRLIEFYIKYKRRKEMDNLNRLCGRLDALRKTRDNLKNIVQEGGDNANLKYKLEKYEDDIKEVRQLRYVEGQMDKQLTKKILMTWKDLVKLRDQQGYQNTSLKLNIKKKIIEDPETEKTKWDADIRKEVKEIVQELKNNYERELEEYKENYKIWCQKTRKKIKENDPAEDDDIIQKLSDTESTHDTESDEDFLEEPKPPKPILVNDVKTQVVTNFKESFQEPGEPKIEFVMSKSTNMDVSAYNNKEELRRAAVKRCKVFIKLFYNGKEVCRSKPQPLNQKFNVKIGQRFAVRILEWPESLMVEVHEETGTLKRNLLVTGIYLPFPDSFTTVQNSEIEKHEFSSNIPVNYHHAAVGSGNKIVPCPDGSDFNNQPLCLYTTGIVACRVGWLDDNGKILAPPEKYWNNKKEEQSQSLSEILKSGGSFDLPKLQDWVEKSKLDPNDPNNSAFFNFLQTFGVSEKTTPSYFRLNPLLEEFDFCKESQIENNIRLKLLKLRDIGEPEFRDIKMIPLNEKQIPKEIFQNYEKRISTTYDLMDVLSTDPLDGHRVWGKKYLEQVQQNLLKKCRMARQNKRYQDIVTEENVPDIRTLGLTFMKWLRPKRPLRPVRKERKKITPQNFVGQEIRIVVNVVRAFEVPVRKDIDSMSTGENIEGFSLVNVRPFVEISFRGMTARTTAAEGANPTWNQDLQIPLKNKNGYFSSGSLQSIKDTLYIHLFDEMVIDLIEEESSRETNIHQRLERHWLASMEIPFSTLHINSRIEGTFKLYSPPVLLGYEREAHRRHFSGPTQEPLLPQRDATYITLFVTVFPAINPPKPIKEKMECSETANLEKHLEGWQQEINNMFPNRKIKTLVLDVTGKSVCVTRFVKSLPLPSIANDEKVTPEMAARFVAMIPYAPESTIFPGFFDIWLTSDQVLHLLCGDSEDHAVLLCSYFLHLKLNAYILLGSGIPHGLMAYVLVKEQIGKNHQYFVWDPTNGQKYNIDDSFCPLQKIYCIINNQNIWANIQTEEIPRRTKFDLTKRADWFPAFNKSFEAPTASVQPQSLEYRSTSRQAVDILQDKIEKKLRDNIMKWRKKSRTQWNRYCAATLRKLLPKLEELTWNLEENSPDHILELHHILASHKMCGFPINMPYTTIDSITEAVKATGVHCNENEGVEFALAVYIHPYPNDVLSVWVYVASLLRRR